MLKRAFDVLVSLAALAVLAPLLIALAVAIKFTSPGAVFYRGVRIGRHGRPFRMLKFRTMVPDADRLGGTSTPDDDPRLTRVGRWMRQYKLDELPQLFNVLAGTMSIVGPRPQVAWAVERYTDAERRLLDVRPGLTDYASIRFSNEGEILRGAKDPDRLYLEEIAPTKIRLSLRYVESHTMVDDLRIIVATVFAAAGMAVPNGVLNDVLNDGDAATAPRPLRGADDSR